jgi:hypothetical protein
MDESCSTDKLAVADIKGDGWGSVVPRTAKPDRNGKLHSNAGNAGLNEMKTIPLLYRIYVTLA